MFDRNVGKSSFMNKVTRADVDVQPYAFTTKALFVGHMDHRYLRWQVVDTPGILDRPLEERNTIEMQAITALAHLQCCVLYFLDISEQCGYPLDQQLRLFESIRPLFANKQVMMVANKTDVVSYESLSHAQRSAIEAVAEAAGAELIPMSNVSESNISALKTRACDKLLEARVESKLTAGRMKDDVLSRITVAVPRPRDGAVREAFIPPTVKAQQAGDAMESGSSRQTERDLMVSNGGAGVYVCDYRKYYLLEEDEWKFDAIPEIMDGKNVMDFFDPDIEERLRALEEEEAALEEQGAYAPEESDEDDLDEEELALHSAIRSKQIIARKDARVTQHTTVPRKFALRGKSEDEVRSQLEGVGYNPDSVDGVVEHTRGRKRVRASSRGPEGMEEEGADRAAPRMRSSSRSDSVFKKQLGRSVSQSATRGPKSVLSENSKKQARKGIKSMERKVFRDARASESDRRHYPKLVKHMNSGKRSLGTSTIGR
jgi:nucleolar GTP-binding protein